MLFLLVAAQLTSTNCIPMGNGAVSCTTMSTPDMSQTTQQSSGGCGLCNLMSVLDSTTEKRHKKAVGSMLAKGDCVGAERYALQKGDLDLADRVRSYCAVDHQANSANNSTPHQSDLEQFLQQQEQQRKDHPK